MHKRYAAFAALLVLSIGAAAPARGGGALEAESERLGQAAGGRVGVAAWRLDGEGPRVLVNGDEPFPMASTFKVAVAGAVLAAVEAETLDLAGMVAVAPEEHVPSDIIAERFVHPGLELSLANLIELMLTESDNTATDVVVRLAGGPRAVTGWVRAQGIDDLRVDRDTAGLLRDFFSLPEGPFGQALAAAVQADPDLVRRGARPNPDFYGDPRDTATPRAMAALLERIFAGRALGTRGTAFLRAAMHRCRTGEGRLKGRLPPGTAVAHKTGTIGGTLNDVGVISLPGGAGDVVVAVFVKESERDFEVREAAIADIGRAVHDFFLFAQAP